MWLTKHAWIDAQEWVDLKTSHSLGMEGTWVGVVERWVSLRNAKGKEDAGNGAAPFVSW